MPNSDDARLRHILDAAKEISEFLGNKSEQQLRDDRLLVLGLQKLIEIIGEATGQLSTELKNKYPEVNWRSAIATRNRLSHGYFDIDVRIIWSTANSEVPAFARQIETILALRSGIS